jgi:DNA-binding NarL/FixJ family response regulator
MTYRVLIVDDSKLARMAVAKLLTALRPQWERIEATNAEEATALARQAPPDMALIDFNMPGQDGLSLAAELRAVHPAMRLAVVSANVQHEVVERARQVGAQFLPKPLTEQALGAFVAEAT